MTISTALTTTPSRSVSATRTRSPSPWPAATVRSSTRARGLDRRELGADLGGQRLREREILQHEQRREGHGRVVRRQERGLLVLHERRGHGRVRERGVGGGALEAGALAQHEQLRDALVRDRDHGRERELDGRAGADPAEVVLGARHRGEHGPHLLDILGGAADERRQRGGLRQRDAARDGGVDEADAALGAGARDLAHRRRARSCPCRPAPSPRPSPRAPRPRPRWATSPSASMRITTSAPAAASAGEEATRTPASAHQSALPSLRFQTVASRPAWARFCAIATPIRPSPRNATFMRSRPRRACRSRCRRRAARARAARSR